MTSLTKNYFLKFKPGFEILFSKKPLCYKQFTTFQKQMLEWIHLGGNTFGGGGGGQRGQEKHHQNSGTFDYRLETGKAETQDIVTEIYAYDIQKNFKLYFIPYLSFIFLTSTYASKYFSLYTLYLAQGLTFINVRQLAFL